MAGGAHMRWNVSIALRVAGRTSVDRLHPIIRPIQFKALALPVYGDAAFPPIVQGVPPATQLSLWCDVPSADVLPHATGEIACECAIQHAVEGQKDVTGPV